MAKATFIKTSMVDSTGLGKSVAVVDVDGEEIQIDFWLDLIDQWGKEGTKQFLCAEALWATGNQVDAHGVLKPGATGKINLDKEGKVITDTRSWQQRWIDEHALQTNIEPVADPLA